jgi:hypothetical protein
MANMVMGKEKSEKDNVFAKGGKTAMFGPQDSSTADAGTSSPANGRKSANNKWGVGYSAGKGRMVGPQAADPQAPGVSGHVAGTSQKWGLPPSKGHMAGWTGSQPAKPA